MGDGVQGGTSPPLSAMTVTEPPCRTTAFGPDTYRVGSHVPPHPRRGGCRPRRLTSTPWTAWSAASPASGPPTPPPCTRGGTWWCSAATPPSTTCSWTTSTCGTVSGMPPFLWLLPSRPSVCTRIRLLCVCVFVWVSLFLHINLQVSVWRHPIPNAALPSNWAPLPPFQPSQPAACRGSDQHRGDGPFRAPPPHPRYLWRKIEPQSEVAPKGRLGHSTVVAGHALYLFGGYGGESLNDLWVFSFGTQQWRPALGGGATRVPAALQLGRPPGGDGVVGCVGCATGQACFRSPQY